MKLELNKRNYRKYLNIRGVNDSRVIEEIRGELKNSRNQTKMKT
jgi:hypothetical protein